MPALALDDEQALFRDPDPPSAGRGPRTGAAPEDHRGDHRPVPVGTQRARERVDLGRGQDPRQPAGPAGQGHALARAGAIPPGRQSRDTGFPAISRRAWRWPKNPETIDSRLATVLLATPTGAPSTPTPDTTCKLSVRPRCGDLLRRAVKGLPAAVCARTRVRADAGYFTAELAQAAEEVGADYAAAAKRNSAFWQELAAVAADAWTPARDMPGAQVAVLDYAPTGWPPDAYTIVGRVRVAAVDISADGRSRRTIANDQLALALGGELDHAWAVSFIVTNLATSSPAQVVAVESWFRGRTDVEERFREAKLGAGLNHLPSGHAGVNTLWMWGALLAGALSVMLQSLTGMDDDAGKGPHAPATSPAAWCPSQTRPPRSSHHPAATTGRPRPGRGPPRIRDLPDRADTAVHPYTPTRTLGTRPPGAPPGHPRPRPPPS